MYLNKFQFSSNKKIWVLFSILYFAIVVFIALNNAADGLIIGGDSAIYQMMANKILCGQNPTNAIWHPGYPYLLAMGKWITGESMLQSAKILHITLFILNALLAIFVVKKMGVNKPIYLFPFSLLISLFTSYRTEAFSMMAELPFITVLLLILLQLPERFSRISSTRIVILSLTFLCLYFIKPNAIAFAFSFIALLWLKGISFSVRLRYSLVFCATFLVGYLLIRWAFGGYRTIHLLVTPNQFVDNFVFELGNIGAVFNGFIINANEYLKIQPYHYLFTLLYFTLLFIIIYSEIKLDRSTKQSSISLYCIISINVYLIFYVCVTSLSYPQINPRTMLFVNLFLLFNIISLAYRHGLHQKSGLFFYGMLVVVFVFGFAYKRIFNPIEFTKKKGIKVQQNNAISYLRDYLEKPSGLVIYTDKPKEMAVIFESDYIFSLPGIPVWQGNRAVYPSGAELNQQFKIFELVWCSRRNSIILILEPTADRNRYLNLSCDSKKLEFDDGLILFR